MLIIVFETHKADFLERKQRALKNNNNFLFTPQNAQKTRRKAERKTSSAKDRSIRSNTNGPKRERARWKSAGRFCLWNRAGLRASSGKGPARLLRISWHWSGRKGKERLPETHLATSTRCRGATEKVSSSSSRAESTSALQSGLKMQRNTPNGCT